MQPAWASSRISAAMTLGRMAPLAPARRRHDAERAVLLAALHDGDEGLEAARRVRPGGDLDEGALARLEHGAVSGLDARHELADAGDGRRPEHEVDVRRALLDAALLELGHAPHHPDDQVGPRALQVLEGAELGVHLVLGLLPDRTGVEEDQVGVVGPVGQLIRLALEQAGDPLGVVLVHLTTIRDQVKLGHDLTGRRRARARGAILRMIYWHLRYHSGLGMSNRVARESPSI